MSDEALAQNLYNQVMELWVLPEIERRQLAGTLPKPVDFRAAQIIFSIVGAPRVRLNNEVKAIMEGRAKVPKEKGDPIYESDVEDVRFTRLLEEDQNFAHITMVRLGDKWQFALSFLYGAQDARAMLDVGKEFLDSARADVASQRIRPAINNLFIAAEQIARTALSLHPLEGGYRKAKTHRPLAAAINQYSKTGDIIPTEYAAAYNKTRRLVAAARYDPEFSVPQGELDEMIEDIGKLWARVNIDLTIHTTGKLSSKLGTDR